MKKKTSSPGNIFITPVMASFSPETSFNTGVTIIENGEPGRSARFEISVPP